MPMNDEYREAWKRMSARLEELPLEERRRYQRSISLFVHDLRHLLGIIYSAESLLTKKLKNKSEEAELLDMIHTANIETIDLLTDFAKCFDGEITLPIRRREEDT